MGFRGLRVVLVAKSNRKYHRTGLGLRAGLRALGCEVRAVDPRTRGLAAWLGRSLADRLRGALPAADLVLSFHGGELDPAVIAALRPRSRARWINWFPDAPHRLELSLRNGAAYDRCFLFDRSMVDHHRALGRDAEYLPLGFDPAFYRPVPVNGAASHGTASHGAASHGAGSPVLFVGSPEPNRDAALAAVADLGLDLYGPGRPRGPLFGKRLVRAYSAARVALNVHQFFADPAARAWYGTGANQRVFEIAGMGTAQLCDAKADLTSSFEEDREIVLFRDHHELRAKAEALLADSQWRRALGERARRRALAEHTWQHRLDELLTRALR
jgi:spore maturation protein CgeB